MNLYNYLKDDAVFIVPNNFKEEILSIIDRKNLLYNIKVYTINEIKRKIIFDYDEKTILFLVNKYKMDYAYAKDVINSIYLLNYDIHNYKEYSDIKDDLVNNNLLYFDNLFLDSLKEKNIYTYGFSYVYGLEEKLINEISSKYKVINIEEISDETPKEVFEFPNINFEIEYIANDIINKTKNGTSINNIYLANVNDEYINTIKRVFSFYKIPINLNEKTSLYNISDSRLLLDNLDNYENYIKSISDITLKNKCIDLINKFYFVDDKTSIYDIIMENLKNTFIIKNIYSDSVNIIDLKTSIILDDDLVYFLGAGADYIPVIKKDEDLINDSIKPSYLEKTWKLNSIELDILKYKVKHTKNMIITFSNSSLKGEVKPSPVVKGYPIIKKEYSPSNFSNESNLYNLGIMMDNNIKYGEINSNLFKLLFNYKDNKYMTYDNKYDQINKNLIKSYIGDKLSLSYSKLDKYYKCPFNFYVEYILKIKLYEDNFGAYLGSLVHYILSKIYDEGFDLNNEKDIFMRDNPFDLTKENILFLNKTCNDLEHKINYILSFEKNSMYNQHECEKKFDLNEIVDGVKIEFTGFIDKISMYKNNAIIVDYKSYDLDIDLSLLPYGLNMQFPTYIYLMKKTYDDININGIYLQNVNRVLYKDEKKTYKDIIKDNTKLMGYTIDNIDEINKLDFTYENSDYIKSMKLGKNGFNAHTKLLSRDEFNSLYKIAENNILNAAKNIIDGKFDISPKIVNNKNISCQYCNYKDVCFYKDKDFIYPISDKELNFLRGDKDEFYL